MSPTANTSSSISSSGSLYRYQASLALDIVGLMLFVLSTVVHSYQMWIFRSWWLVVLILGRITEIIGYAARIYSWSDDININAFLAQTVTLILAPSFFSGPLYVTFGQIIYIVEGQYSILAPKWYTIIFVTADLISLTVQAVGAGQAAVVVRKKGDTTNETHIMVVGICFQLFSMSICIARDLLHHPTNKRKSTVKSKHENSFYWHDCYYFNDFSSLYLSNNRIAGRMDWLYYYSGSLFCIPR